MTSCGLEANQLKIKQPSTRLGYWLTASFSCERQSKRNRIWQQHKYRGTCCTWSCMFKLMTPLATNARRWLTLLAALKHSDLVGSKTRSSDHQWPYIGTQPNIRFYVNPKGVMRASKLFHSKWTLQPNMCSVIKAVFVCEIWRFQSFLF